MPLSLSPFAEVGLLLAITTVAGAIAVRLRQPVLIAYIAVGILVGPSVLGFVHAEGHIELLAEVGVAVLLFLVGLKLDLYHIRHIGPVALATGLGQLAFTIVFGFIIALGLGREWLEALYIAVALTFSSTIIIIKLLSDKRELDTLHGRIAVGFLIVQDIAVVIAMMIMGSMGGGETGWAAVTLGVIIRLVGAAALMFVLMRYVLPYVVQIVARSQELLLLFAIAWGVGLAVLGELLGFSMEAGAFLAGFSLASTHYREAMSARLTGVRDFLLLFFFIELGAKLDLTTLGAELNDATVFSVFVLVGNPLIVMAIMGFMGYRRRTGFMAGLTVAQISEFSIVFVAMGISLGHVGVQTLGLTTLVGLVTIALSSYMILYAQTLYEWVGPLLRPFERATPFREQAVEAGDDGAPRVEVIVFGLGRYGERLLERLAELGIPALGVDFDPEVVRRLRDHGLSARFGDAEDPAFLESLPLRGAEWVITTLPQWPGNRALLSALRGAGYAGQTAGAVRDELHGYALHRAGVDRVLNVFEDATEHAARLLATELRGEEVSDAPA